MKVERPDWTPLLRTFWQDEIGIPSPHRLDGWFDEHIAPYEFYNPKDAVEVYAHKAPEFDKYFCSEIRCPRKDTHKALLINIEPIKEDSIQDIVRDLAEGNYPAAEDMGALDTVIDYFKDRAKKAIEREGK